VLLSESAPLLHPKPSPLPPFFPTTAACGQASRVVRHHLWAGAAPSPLSGNDNTTSRAGAAPLPRLPFPTTAARGGWICLCGQIHGRGGRIRPWWPDLRPLWPDLPMVAGSAGEAGRQCGRGSDGGRPDPETSRRIPTVQRGCGTEEQLWRRRRRVDGLAGLIHGFSFFCFLSY
jgi:hypothetical protein